MPLTTSHLTETRRPWIRGMVLGIRTPFFRSPRPRTVPELPYGVWRHILQFLSGFQVAAMISVNRACFEAAMDERYRSVRLHRDHAGFRYFTRLQDPSISRRVRTVHLSSEIFHPNPNLVENVNTRPRKRDRLMRLARPASFKKKSQSKLLEFRTTDGAINSMADAFSEMAQGRLKNLTLCCRLGAEVTTHTDRYHEFRLSVGAMMQALFRAKIESLKHTTIYFYPDPEGAKWLTQTLIEFVNKQETTPRSLTFSNAYTLVTLPRPVPFPSEGLEYFPSLQKFILKTPLNDIGALAFWKFIDRHKNTLTDLTIKGYQPVALNGIHFPMLHFPVLVYVNLGVIDPATSTSYIPGITALLKCAPSLLVLRLPTHHLHSHEDACAILEALASCRKLRWMAMSLENLNPQILARFAKRLPNLVKLTLRIGGYNDLELQEGSAEERLQ